MAKESGESINVNWETIPFGTDGLTAPAIYLDAVKGAAVGPEVTKLNLVEYRMNALGEEVVAVHVATLVMPTSQVPAWAEFFTRLVKDLPGKSEGDSNG